VLMYMICSFTSLNCGACVIECICVCLKHGCLANLLDTFDLLFRFAAGSRTRESAARTQC